MPSSKPYNSEEQAPSDSKHGWSASEGSGIISTSKVESALKRTCKSNAKYEYLMKDLESRLSDDLSNFRAIEGLMQNRYKGLQRTAQRSDKALNHQVPQIKEELDYLTESLTELVETLPTTRTQVSDIKQAYDSGRGKAQALVSDLSWLNTEFYERWRMIIFTSSSPVSLRWKIYIRLIFVVSFIICSWLSWIAITGAYRAHRHRLVWGEKLMS